MGLLDDLGAWLDQKKRNVAVNAQNLPGLLASFAQDVQQGAAADKSAWDASRSVMPGVREAGIREMNARGQELGGLLGTFAGVGAKTADVVKLEQAKKMAKAGADPVEVWKQTGWTDQFPDGKWRFEIPDTDARFKYVKATDKGVTTAEQLDHPLLDAAYPDMAAIPKDIKFGNRVQSSGSYRDIPAESISAHGVDPNDAYGIVFHEGQHAVQRREGFAQGGSPESMYDLLEKEARNANKAGDYKRARQLREQQSIAIWDGMGPYRRLAGEAEARLTQSRMNLTPAERAARPPWLEFDVPREEQIVRGLLGEPTGPAMSVGPSKQRGIIGDWRWKGADKVKQEVGINELPPYIADNYGQFMKEQRGRADAGQLGARDLLKAYGITRSSVNRGAREISDDLAQGSVRPEGYMAEWLLSPQGKAYLDAAEKGQVNAEAIADIQKRFAPFGMADTLANDLTYAAQQLAPINGSVNAAVTGPVDQWRVFAQGLNGIGPAKSGFIASLLGRGDLPTLDARQLALHTGKPAKEASKYMRRAGGKGGDAAVDRLAERQKAMGVAVDESLNPFYQHLTHHAVWDKVGGTQTTHEDLIRAMKLAGIGGFGLLGAGAYGSDYQ